MELSLHRHRGEHPGFDVPHPLRAGLGLGLLSVVPLALGAGGLIRPLSGLVFAGLFVGAGALRWSFEYAELVGLRRSADRELRLGRGAYLHTPLVAWRSAELTDPHRRAVLAGSVAHTARDASAATLPGASPLNRAAVRPYLDLFEELAGRLEALDRQVTPRGMLLVEDLLTSPESPLYAREHAGDMRAAILDCLAALDGTPDSRGRLGIPTHRIGGPSDEDADARRHAVPTPTGRP